MGSDYRKIAGIYNVAQGCLKRKENFVQPAMRIRVEYLFWLSYNYPIEINHPKNSSGSRLRSQTANSTISPRLFIASSKYNSL